MKKLVLAASIAVLGLSAQAANTSSTSTATNGATSTPSTAAASTTTTPTNSAMGATTASSAAPAKKADKAPQDSPETKMFEQNYPGLVKRISPVGRVCEVNKKCSVAALQPMSLDGAANVGEIVYQNVCSSCHDAGLLNAPIFENKALWAPRIAKGKATLYQHAINGFNQMPAKGGDAQLSDADVKSAVDYIVTKSS